MDWREREQGRRIFVVSTWLAATVAALVLVYCYSSNSPYADEWPWLDVVVGDRAFGAAWLLEPENHHRVPLAKLLYVGLARATNYDFRAGAVANVLVLSLASLALLWAVRRARGETRLSDAILPVALLHLGHWYNLIWGHQLFFAIAAATMCGVIGVVLNTPGARAAFRNGILVALAGAVLNGCGGPGVCFLPAIALWLAYAGVVTLRSDVPRRNLRGVTLLAAAGVSLLLVALYFSGNRPTEGLPEVPIVGLSAGRLLATARGAFQVLSISAGRLGRDMWPISGFVVAAVGIVAFFLLANAWRREPAERLRAVGLACSILAVATTALGVGWSRGLLDPTYCLTPRYSMLACPLVAALYGVFLLYGGQPRWRFADATVAGVAIVIGCAYVSTGVHQSQEIRARVARMELLVADGISPEGIATRSAYDMQDEEKSLARHLRQMRAARMGPYRDVPEALPIVDTTVHRLPDFDPATAQRTTTTIGAGQPWTQVLRFTPGERVFRVDLRVRSKLHRSPLPEALEWKIVEYGAADLPATKASGKCSLADLADPMFAPLRFEPFAALAERRYELIVTAAAVGDASPLKLPVYGLADERVPRALDGYVYVLRDEGANVVAAAPGEAPR